MIFSYSKPIRKNIEFLLWYSLFSYYSEIYMWLNQTLPEASNAYYGSSILCQIPKQQLPTKVLPKRTLFLLAGVAFHKDFCFCCFLTPMVREGVNCIQVGLTMQEWKFLGMYWSHSNRRHKRDVSHHELCWVVMLSCLIWCPRPSILPGWNLFSLYCISSVPELFWNSDAGFVTVFKLFGLRVVELRGSKFITFFRVQLRISLEWYS